jgi:hypothetical protein
MPKERSVMSVCPRTGITHPECCCAECLTDQVRKFQPGLLEADAVGEIRVTRSSQADARDRPPGSRAAL